jgi:hypothetical protein
VEVQIVKAQLSDLDSSTGTVATTKMEVQDHNNLINCIEVAAADIIPRQLVSVMD